MCCVLWELGLSEPRAKKNRNSSEILMLHKAPWVKRCTAPLSPSPPSDTFKNYWKMTRQTKHSDL